MKNTHLIKSEDLNHHGTLYAGRAAEWLVEAGFIAAATLTNPEQIVCKKIHGLEFKSPAKKGQLLQIESNIIFAGRTRLVAYIKASVNDKELVNGFLSFVNINSDGKPLPHNIIINPISEEDKQLFEIAKDLK